MIENKNTKEENIYIRGNSREKLIKTIFFKKNLKRILIFWNWKSREV